MKSIFIVSTLLLVASFSTVWSSEEDQSSLALQEIQENLEMLFDPSLEFFVNPNNVKPRTKRGLKSFCRKFPHKCIIKAKKQ
uniref:Uncharacterized protein n=1 Tax=Lepeophtheirus salmonis TaxID=72036 RepID=A7TZA5_LEPSM|nr:hypothetical protein [Lepeophtheirus salmonis]